MKKIFLFGFGLLFIAAIFAHGEDTPIKVVTLNENDIIDHEELLEKNEVFYRMLNGFEKDEKNHLYYLLDNHEIIFKVEMDTKKLKRTISSRGQGPGQLSNAKGMVITNERILVYDPGFGGIKLFDTEGNCLKETRTGISGISAVGNLLKNIIGMNEKNEIFLRDIMIENNTSISVFDINGKKLRSIIPVNSKEENPKQVILNTHFVFKLDKNGDIIVLYTKKGILKKFDTNGTLVWERDLYHDLPPGDKRNDIFEVDNAQKSMRIKYNLDFLGFCLTESDDIFVGTYKGGIYYDKTGIPLFILKQPSGIGFGSHLVWHKNRLFTPDKIFLIKI